MLVSPQAAGAHPPASDIVLSVDNLYKTFAVKKKPAVLALQGISLQACKGQVTGVVGADGAGKTTLIRIAAGLLVPTSGKVRVLGLDSVADTLQIQSRVGYMPQKFGLYQDLTVEENMNLYADLQGVPGGERESRYKRLLEMTDLSRYTRRRAGALSGGMKQKLGLACALIKSPEILLLDEPTVGVDPVSRRELWKIVYELVDTDGIGVFVSTAYLDEAERCGYVVVLHRGQILAEGTPEEFMRQVEGRVSIVVPGKDEKPRRIYTHLANQKHIVDVTIRSGRVRVVTEQGKAEAVAELTAPFQVAIEAADPRFEDAFMALIPQAESHFRGRAGPMESALPAGRKQEAVILTRGSGETV